MTKLVKCQYCEHIHPKTYMIKITTKYETYYICGVKCDLENNMYCIKTQKLNYILSE